MNKIPDFVKKATHDWEVWESDLSDFVSNYYGRPWRMQQHTMMGQDTYTVINIGPDVELEPWELEINTVESWLAEPYEYDENVPNSKLREDLRWERGHYVRAEVVMQDLYEKGELPAGKYLITVWW